MRINKRSFIRRLFALSSAPLLGSEQGSTKAPETSGGMSNGRKWNGLDDAAQLYLVIGIRDGMRHVYEIQLPLLNLEKIINDKLQVAEDRIGSGSTFGEIQNQITIYYKDPANAVIPVADIYYQAVRKFKGATQAEIEDAFVVLRKIYTGELNLTAPK
jgi:hypothetical protein